MGIASQVGLLIVLIAGILSSPRPYGATKRAGRGYFLLTRLGGWVIGIPAFVMAGVAMYLSYAQFIAWQGNAISNYLLPPHAPAMYFARYAFFHFWMPYMISGIIGLLVFWAARILNKKYNERFFEQEELYFLTLGILITGHPGWILYSIVVLLAYLLVTISHSLYAKETPRVSFYYWWLPCAALTIVVSSYMPQIYDIASR